MVWLSWEKKQILDSFNLRCDVVVLKELIFNNFYFGMVWWPWKELIFNSFYFGRMCVVLKELIFNSFYFGTVWCGGLERTDF